MAVVGVTLLLSAPTVFSLARLSALHAKASSDSERSQFIAAGESVLASSAKIISIGPECLTMKSLNARQTSDATSNALVGQNLYFDLLAWLHNSGLCC